MESVFYVYEHVRKDSGAVFYVGKGKDRRAVVKQGRNRYWHNVVRKAAGFHVAYLATGLPEELAHLVEIERIDQLRRIGVPITNLADGGEGSSGFAIPRESVDRRAALMRGKARPDVSALFKGVKKSDEHRKRLSEACKGRRLSEETKRKIGEASKGRPSAMRGKRHTEETKRKIADALMGEKNHFFGKSHSPDAVAKIRAGNIGKQDFEETRKRKSLARRGELNPNYGVPVSAERKARQIATLMSRPRLVCPHCAKTTNEGNARRWHFDRCRDKK